MSQASRISVTIPKPTLDKAQGLLNQLQALLQPYLISLTIDERSTIVKMSEKSVSFVRKTIGYTDSNKGFIPSFLDVAEMRRDFELVDSLKPVFDLSHQLSDQLSDTMMVGGSEAFLGALLYYNSVRGASKQGIAGARSIYDDLAARFPNPRRKAADPGGAAS